MAVRKFSKHAANSLYIYADGRCEICGADLDQVGMHSDHVLPFSKGGETRIHNGQALCPTCNLRKGASMQGFRAHQKSCLDIFEDISNDKPGFTNVKKVVFAVTPGGGKSLLPIISGRLLLDAGKIDRICWIVPRSSLQEQAAKTFIDNSIKKFFPHSMEIRESTNEKNPSRNTNGYVTTYQAIGADSFEINRFEFDRYRHLLILDEPHHLSVGSDWYKSVLKLYERASYVIMMSGTLSRHDKKQIPFIDYIEESKGVLRINHKDTETTRFVMYSRKSALADGAIVPIEFRMMDAKASWRDTDNNICTVDSLDIEDEDQSRNAIFTILNTDYAKHLLDEALSHWNTYRKDYHVGAKLLVVAPTQVLAKKYLKWLKQDNVKSAIAISDDSKEALQNINLFKEGHVDALVTVAMAYEGLDVPSATHIACLTHIRSKEWLEQLFARTVRIDPNGPKYELQRGFVFVPDDMIMRDVVNKIQEEQDGVARLKQEVKEKGGKDRVDGGFDDNIVPIQSVLTRQRVQDDSGELDYIKTHVALTLMNQYNVSMSVIDFNDMIDLAIQKRTQPIKEKEMRNKTVKERETDLRNRIKEYVSAYESENGIEFGTINGDLLKKFRIPRAEMNENELFKVLQYVQANYKRRACA